MGPMEIRWSDLLACPDCRQPLSRQRGGFTCNGCARQLLFVAGGIPDLRPAALARGAIRSAPEVAAQHPHEPAVARALGWMATDQAVLDLGAGDRLGADPRQLRLALQPTPNVDALGCPHRLPLRDASIDLVVAGGVLQRWRRPFAVAAEIARVLKPGGQVAVDCPFVAPDDGGGTGGFRASAAGIRALFAGFHEVAAEVRACHMPSFALEGVLAAWLRQFAPRDEHDRAFVAALQQLRQFDWRRLDRGFTQAAALPVAAAITWLGLWQPGGDDHLLPPAAMTRWHADPALQRHFPQPAALIPTIVGDTPSLLGWSRTECRDPEVAAWFASRPQLVADLRE